jgi:hypothetical protein
MVSQDQQAQTGAAQRILLIGGAMRSGTTVIHRTLCTARNSNPYISESWFLHDILNLYKWNLSRYEVRSADQFGAERNFSELIKINMQYYFRMVSTRYHDPEVLIFKHPELTRHFPSISMMFPAIRFLAIVRDPRDVIASIKEARDKHLESGVKSPVTPLQKIDDLCRHYASYYASLGSSNLRGRLRFVRYEDVMRDPKGTIAGIGEFCGADYDLDAAATFNEDHAASTNFNKEVRLRDPISGAFWSDMYTKDLSSERIGRFADSLTAAEIDEIQTRLRGFGKRFNYWE